MKAIYFILLCLLPALLVAQTEKEKEARELCITAIEKMDNGEVDESILLLKKAQKLDPNNLAYKSAMGFAYTLKKDYKKAISILKKVVNDKNTFPRAYQLLGNSYDYNGQPEVAIKTYEDGLKKFPNSGELYLERGNMELAKEAYNNALDYYVQGTLKAPEFPSNYFWCARIYMGSEERYLGFIYGELFMNLERGSKRTEQISKELYFTYEKAITITSDSSMSVDVTSDKIVVNDVENFKLPYGLMVYAPVFSISCAFVKNISIESLMNTRSTFLEQYYEMGHYEKYPIVLFDYQKKIEEEGHFEAYNYWLLMKGNEREFDTWLEENETKWSEFIKWYKENPIEITEETRFVQP